MNQRLVYVIGPSGAGKDTVLHELRLLWPWSDSAHWARRTITRPTRVGDEQHESVDPNTFDILRRNGAFAMHWTANALSYGIRHRELAALQLGRWVFVNGSRAWLPQLLRRWPRATVVYIGARPDILADRLIARGRESVEAVTARLARQTPLSLPRDAIEIDNSGELAEAVAALERALRSRDPTFG
jgi:ribose 1,5-bisphosphokinase